MADTHVVISASALIITGKGHLTGLVVSCVRAATLATVTCYDNTAGSGTVILQVEIPASVQPFVLFFPERFAPQFDTGLYCALDADLVANVWATDRG